MSYPALVTPHEVRRALNLASEGATLGGIRAALGISYAGWKALLTYPGFADQLNALRALALEERAEELLEVHKLINDPISAKQAELYSRNLTWWLERRLPELFAKRETLDVNVTVDLRAAIAGVRRRKAELEEAEPDVIGELVG